MIQQYLVFGGMTYYPNGGFMDFRKSFASLDDALDYFRQLREEDELDWIHIVDLQTLQVVHYYGFYRSNEKT